MRPVLEAVKELGGSGRPAEVQDLISEKEEVPPEQFEIVTKNGQSQFANRVAWARFYLVKGGYLDSSQRGVWCLTEKGRNSELTDEQAYSVFKAVHGQFASGERRTAKADMPDDAEKGGPESDETVSDHRALLLQRLLKMPAGGFERLCRRLLRESGFEKVTVTGKSGDGGIDGHGVLQMNPFVSFRVLFQCKRYAGTVGASTVRDFRGAMQGRTDKGIILTTGTFSADARKEAVRDGVPPIELVDSEKLLDMFEKLQLGLRPQAAYELDENFFAEFSQ